MTITCKIYSDLTKPGKSDQLKDTINYVDAVDQIQSLLKKKVYVLIEAVAEDIATVVLSFDKTTGIEVRIDKKVLPGTRSVGVVIARQK